MHDKRVDEFRIGLHQFHAALAILGQQTVQEHVIALQCHDHGNIQLALEFGDATANQGVGKN